MSYIVVRETCALKDHAKSTAHKLCTIILTHLPPSHPRCVLFLDRSVCLQLAVFLPFRVGQRRQEATTHRGAVSGPRRFYHVKWWLMHTMHSPAGGSAQSRHNGERNRCTRSGMGCAGGRRCCCSTCPALCWSFRPTASTTITAAHTGGWNAVASDQPLNQVHTRTIPCSVVRTALSTMVTMVSFTVVSLRLRFPQAE